jgi:hypothetical protein
MGKREEGLSASAPQDAPMAPLLQGMRRRAAGAAAPRRQELRGQESLTQIRAGRAQAAFRSTQTAGKIPSRQRFAGGGFMVHERAQPPHRRAKLMPARFTCPPVMNLAGAHVLGSRRGDDQILTVRAVQSRTSEGRDRTRRRCPVVLLHATVLAVAPVTLHGPKPWPGYWASTRQTAVRRLKYTLLKLQNLLSL